MAVGGKGKREKNGEMRWNGFEGFVPLCTSGFPKLQESPWFYEISKKGFRSKVIIKVASSG